MPAVPSRVMIAIVNSNDDLLDILKDFFEQEGYRVATAHARTFREQPEMMESFLATYDPKVFLWDIAPPFEEHWHFFQTISQSLLMQGRRFVLTSTNEQQVREVAGSEEEIVEVVGKPFDLAYLLQAVGRAIQKAQT